MPIVSVADLVETLRGTTLLDAEQWSELPRDPAAEYADPSTFVQALVYRGWLTHFQADQLLLGNAKELVLGPYRLMELIGEGGMGRVYKAVHCRLQRTEALKVIRPERLLRDPDAIRRFHREAQSAAKLTHPNVVIIYNIDQIDDTHFISMEFVDGIDLSRMVKENGPLSIPTACDFVRQAATGLQAAYESGLVHRDIKPSNLLATTPKTGKLTGNLRRPGGNGQYPADERAGGLGYSSTNVIKILDLGLARLIPTAESKESSSHSLTEEGAVMGTPDYIAPEQARNSHAVDIRADLYSLGCTFYFLLTGRPPFPRGTTIEKLLMHQLDDPRPIRDLRPDLPEDIVTVVARLMAKRPDDRFQVPNDVCAALTLLLSRHCEATTFGPTTGRDAALNPASYGPTSSIATLSTNDRDKLVQAMRDDSPGTDRTGNDRHGNTFAPGMTAATNLLIPGSGSGSHPPLASSNHTPLTGGPLEPTLFEPLERVAVLNGHKGSVLSLAFDPRGQLLASGGVDGPVRIWNLSTSEGKLHARLDGHPGDVTALAFSPSDGALLASGSGTLDGCVWLWDCSSSKPLVRSVLRGHNSPVNALHFAPDGKSLALGCNDTTARIWDVARPTPAEKSVFRGHKRFVMAVVFSPDGKMLASGSEDGSIGLWRVGALWFKNVAMVPAHTGPVYTVTFSGDGGMLASGSLDKSVFLCDLGDKPQERAMLEGHSDVVRLVSFSDEGRQLISIGGGGRVVVWDVQTATKQREWVLPRGMVVACVALSADGRLLATGNNDGTIFVYKLSK